MGNAAGVDATASGRILVRQESMKPSDASDMADLESAKSEVSRLRYLASEVASGKFVDDDLDDDDDNLPAPEAVDKLALSMNLSGHDYTPQGAPPREEAAIARRKSLPPMALPGSSLPPMPVIREGDPKDVPFYRQRRSALWRRSGERWAFWCSKAAARGIAACTT